MRRIAVVLVAFAVLGSASAASAHVLRVGTYKGIRRAVRSIQAAVDAARPGDGPDRPWRLQDDSSGPPAGRTLRPAS